MRYLLILLVFASCQPVSRYHNKETTEDTAEIKDCQNRLKECAESNQVLQDSLDKLNKAFSLSECIMGVPKICIVSQVVEELNPKKVVISPCYNPIGKLEPGQSSIPTDTVLNKICREGAFGHDGLSGQNIKIIRSSDDKTTTLEWIENSRRFFIDMSQKPNGGVIAGQPSDTNKTTLLKQ